MKNFLRAVWGQLIRLSPPWLAYRLRSFKELLAFRGNADVHELPAIFHYWSNKYLGPEIFNPHGIQHPEHFFCQYVVDHHARKPEKFLHLISFGCGNADMECRLACELRDAGIDNFLIECVDINAAMLQRGEQLAKQLQVEKNIKTSIGDFNNWQPARRYDIVLANQCLHHVAELEDLFSKIKAALADDGRVLVSDMIGRNGHQRWPEALSVVNELWETLPPEKKYNHVRQRQETHFIDHDCAASSFEGIRAQDILPLLIANFHFELFLPFGNLVFVFIERTFGPNFNPAVAADREFIDRVQARDEAGLASGELKPTQMLAVLTKSPVTQPVLRTAQLTPQFCIRVPD